MLRSAEILAGAGADFLICPDNTIHQAMNYVLPRSPLPWLHIAEIVAREAAARGYRLLGVTGTKWLVDSDVYPEKLAVLGLDCIKPEEMQCVEINRIIMDELVKSRFRPSSLTCFQKTFTALKEKGCDAVILGSTEIPLIINDDNSPLPTLDSTRLLAQAALLKAVENKKAG